jgi:hypothetical protein
MVGEGAPPGILEDQVEAVFPFASRSGFHLDTRLFSIESIDYPENQGDQYAWKKVAPGDCHCPN